ncbi:MAG TPA: CAP domain-containing protein [Planctomycetota bacterium]|nr:CAP domain-containing protein [Planctomycetota bacterium]
MMLRALIVGVFGVAVLQDGGSETEKLEKAVAAEINAKRKEQGLTELKVFEELSYVARQQAEEFERQGIRGHQGREWGFVEERANALFGWSVPTNQKPDARQPAKDMMTDNSFDIDEEGHLGEGELRWVIEGWMNSRGHREAILMKTTVYTGVGISSKRTRIFQIFASLTAPRARALEEIARLAPDLDKGEADALAAVGKILALNEGAAVVRLAAVAKRSKSAKVQKKACEAVFQLNKKIRALKGAVPELIDLLEVEATGEDSLKHLRSLTGQSLGKDANAWREWWASARKGFTVK